MQSRRSSRALIASLALTLGMVANCETAFGQDVSAQNLHKPSPTVPVGHNASRMPSPTVPAGHNASRMPSPVVPIGPDVSGMPSQMVPVGLNASSMPSQMVPVGPNASSMPSQMVPVGSNASSMPSQMVPVGSNASSSVFSQFLSQNGLPVAHAAAPTEKPIPSRSSRVVPSAFSDLLAQNDLPVSPAAIPATVAAPLRMPVETKTTTTTTTTQSTTTTTDPLSVDDRRTIQNNRAKITTQHIKKSRRVAYMMAKYEWLDKVAAANPQVLEAICERPGAARVLAKHHHIDAMADVDHYLCRRLTRWKGATSELIHNPKAAHVLNLDPEGIYYAIDRDPHVATVLASHVRFDEMLEFDPNLGRVIDVHMR